MRISRAVIAVLLAIAAGPALAEGGARPISAPELRTVERDASLQRGARDFANYCLNCHSAQFMR